jgi:hypothetical protein
MGNPLKQSCETDVLPPSLANHLAGETLKGVHKVTVDKEGNKHESTGNMMSDRNTTVEAHLSKKSKGYPNVLNKLECVKSSSD